MCNIQIKTNSIIVNKTWRSVYNYQRNLPVIACLFISDITVAAYDNQLNQYQTKEAYLYNFSQFTKWPVMPSSDSAVTSIDVCVPGENPFHAVTDTSENNTDLAVEVAIRKIEKVSQSKDCEILLISQSEKYQLTPVLEELIDQPVLTVSDIDNSSSIGGFIELMTGDGKIILNINMLSIRRADLKISAEFLELAKVIIDT